jgi:protein tyrosine phosphatase (PTP) superfamily phosphohydrolase (DUF442 family)
MPVTKLELQRSNELTGKRNRAEEPEHWEQTASNRMRDLPTTLTSIYRFRLVGELGTAGQPTAEQMRLICDAGFEAVINLALPASERALANEGNVVSGLGMAYVHLPVNFKSPTAHALRMFFRVMEAFSGCPVFVHCVANKRVSAFVFLHRVLRRRVALAEAARDLHAVWTPDPIWDRFIQQELKAYRPAGGRARILTVGA